jgi:archaeosine-15-forming tRNA-guanine transglycosylase
MASLVEILTNAETRPRVVRACNELIAAEVAAKGGLAGIAVKGAYRLVQAIKPAMVSEVVDKLLPEFAAALEPFFAASAAAGDQPRSRAFAELLVAQRGPVSEALLSVTDSRAAKASGPLQKTYAKLRGSAQEHVDAAVPGLARTISPFV